MDEETRKIVEESMNKAHRIGYLAGAEAMRERAARSCIELWKNFQNKAPDFRQNAISHGCIECDVVIRALPLEAEKGKS